MDGVLPRVPVRQWVLGLPYRLRYLLAGDHRLCRAVLGIYVRGLAAIEVQERQPQRGVPDGHTGTLTVIQRLGHRQPFHPASPPPSDEEVARLLATILVRVRRLLRRRGLEGDDDLIPSDPLAEESVALAAITSASVQGRIARVGRWFAHDSAGDNPSETGCRRPTPRTCQYV